MNNTELSIYIRNLDNIGVLETKLPFEIFEGLTSSIDDLDDTENKKYNGNLLGHMQEEYSLNHIKESMSDYILTVANTWAELHPNYIATFEEAAKNKNYGLYLDSMWVNKQKKYEFNPVHHHSGVLSFVIWIKIPYNLEDEVNYFPPVSGLPNENYRNSYTSKFSFYYNDILGRIVPASVPVDKSFEGTMLMFPASLSHAVYPFYTSDDYRISVSGNIRIKVLDDKDI
jgi:hypothetical protein